MKTNIKIETGDHTKELKRIHRLLLPQELKDKTQKKLSEYEAAKRWKLREDVIRLAKVIEEQGLDVDLVIDILQRYQPTRRRPIQQSMFTGSQYPT